MEDPVKTISPLRPLKDRLCFFKACGLPFIIRDKEALSLSPKPYYWIMPYLKLAVLALVLVFGTSAHHFVGGIGDVFLDIHSVLEKSLGFGDWEFYSVFIVAIPNVLVPFAYSWFYRGMHGRLATFLRLYSDSMKHLVSEGIMDFIGFFGVNMFCSR